MAYRPTIALWLAMFAQLYVFCSAQRATATELSSTSPSPQERPSGDDWTIELTKDSRRCCGSGEGQQATAAGNLCFYPDSMYDTIIPGAEQLGVCCWDYDSMVIHAHDFQSSPSTTQDVDIQGSDQFPNDFCNLGVKWDFTKAEVYGGYMNLLLNLNVDCSIYNGSDEEWVTITFDENYNEGGKFTFVISDVGPTIYLDLTTKVNTDRSVGLHGHVTGSGVIGNLDESFDWTLNDPNLSWFLQVVDICPAR